jgi:hypothetical protein
MKILLQEWVAILRFFVFVRKLSDKDDSGVRPFRSVQSEQNCSGSVSLILLGLITLKFWVIYIIVKSFMLYNRDVIN